MEREPVEFLCDGPLPDNGVNLSHAVSDCTPIWSTKSMGFSVLLETL